MKFNPDLNASWADGILLRLQSASRRLDSARQKIEAFDALPYWKRLLAGGRLYRWWLVVEHIHALEEFMMVDLEMKE